MRRLARVLAATLVAAGMLATPAVAEEQPAVLKAYGLDWIERVRDDAWPQPKEQRPVICLLDTGVAVTPDTPEDNPLGPIVARLALDGGTGLPQGDTFEHRHGTDMASVIAAPRNGYGTVGVFPQARIVSVRVTEGDETFISPADVRHGVAACRRWAVAAGPVAIGSVVMAEAKYEQRELDTLVWSSAVQQAAELGGVFVAASGNAEGNESLPPLSVDQVLTVSAGDDDGNACSFAGTPRLREIRGPGCSAQRLAGVGAWPSGSSAATAAVGALLAAVAARSPSEGGSERAAAVLGALASMPDGGRRLDGVSLRSRFEGFVSAPVSATEARTTEQGPAAIPVSPSPALPSLIVKEGQVIPRTSLWRPSVSAKWRHGRLTVNWLGSRQGRLLIVTEGQKIPFTTTSRRTMFRLPKRPQRISAWAESRTPGAWRSLTMRARVAG